MNTWREGDIQKNYVHVRKFLVVRVFDSKSKLFAAKVFFIFYLYYVNLENVVSNA